MPLSAETVSRALQIILIDLLLSGDNAVVIGVVAHPPPRRQRAFAIVIGGGAAILLRVALTGGAALLLALPILKLVGGALLLWIAYKLIEQEEEASQGVKAYVGGAAIAWTGIDMILDDPLLAEYVTHLAAPLRLVLNALVTLAVVALARRSRQRSAAPR